MSIVNLFYTYIPELILMLGLVYMGFAYKFRKDKTPKTFYTISKYSIIFSVLVMMFFSPHIELKGASLFINSLKLSMMSLSMLWFFLSCKYFLNKDINSYRFYSIGLGLVCSYLFMIDTQSLLVLYIAIFASFILNYLLIRSYGEKGSLLKKSNYYLGFGLFFNLLFAASIYCFYKKVGDFNYSSVYDYLYNISVLSLDIKLAIGSMVAVFMFYLSLAPFHFLYPQLIENSRLPTGGFFAMIPSLAYYGVFCIVVLDVLFPAFELLKPIIRFFALFSILLGAISANNQKNIRTIFAYSSIFHLGVLVMGLLEFNHNNIFSSFIYLIIYLTSQLGIYTIFYSMKSKGDYINDLDDLKGFAIQRPYMGAGILVFMISLIGSPPMLGFVGKLFIINDLILNKQYLSLGLIMFSLVLIVDAYLKVIKVLFFEQGVRKYDRTESGIYVCLFIILVFILASIFNPGAMVGFLENVVLEVFR